jgi:hypothetical protein
MPTTDDINHRALPPEWLQQAHASHSGDVVLMLITITHPSLTQSARYATEYELGVSFANGNPINYKYDGNLFLGVPFSLALLKDDDSATETKLTIRNVRADISNWLRSLNEPLEFRLQVFLSSQFDDIIDFDNARTILEGKTPVNDAQDLIMVDIEATLSSISARIMRRDVADDPWPRFYTLQKYLPALYWNT